MRVQVSAPLQGLSFLLCPGNKGRLLFFFQCGKREEFGVSSETLPIGHFQRS